MSKQKQKKQFMYTCSELVVFMYWTGKSMNSLLSYCGLIDARISASEKDLPVINNFFGMSLLIDFVYFSSIKKCIDH